MILRPPSQQKLWETYCSKDVAFKQPPTPPGDDASDEQRAEYKAAIEKHSATVVACQETGDWSPLLLEGCSPSKFIMAPIDGNVWRALIDRTLLPADSHRYIGPVMQRTLLFRMALKSVGGWDKFERLPDPAWDNWTMAPADIVKDLDSVNPAIVGELGGYVLDRLRGERPFV